VQSSAIVLNNIGKSLGERDKGSMNSSSRIFLLLIPAGIVAVLATNFGSAFAQTTGQYVYSRIEIWSLFYRLMVIAFVIGAVIMGTMFYIVWRFRESHPRNRGIPPKQQAGGSHH
jgi:heme/copper-type cytochrome/quinol oxidase subunit 2